MARNSDILSQLENLQDGLFQSMDSILLAPINKISKGITGSYNLLGNKLKELGEKDNKVLADNIIKANKQQTKDIIGTLKPEETRKLLSQLHQGQKDQTTEIIEGFNNGNVYNALNSLTKLNNDTFKSNTQIIKNLSESNKKMNVIGDSLEIGVDRLLDKFRHSNSLSMDNLENQRKSFQNLQQQLITSSASDNKLIQQLINIDSRNLDFTEESQKSMRNIFDAIRTDLNSEKTNTSLVNISSTLDLLNDRDERRAEREKNNNLDRKLKDKEEEEKRKKQERDKKNSGILTTVLNGLGSLMGVGGLGLAIPLLTNTVKSIGGLAKNMYSFVTNLPNLTSNLYNRLTTLASETITGLGKGLDFIKNMGSKGANFVKDLGTKGVQVVKGLGGKVVNMAKGAGSKVMNFAKGAGGKALAGGGLVAGAVYDAGKGFEKTEEIMNKQGQEFGTLDIINSGGVNALTLNGLLADPKNVQQKIEGSLDSIMSKKLPANPTAEAKKQAKANVKNRQSDMSMLGKPLKNMPVSSGFGWRVHPIYGTKKFHRGADFPLATGTPIYAPFDGKVIFAGNGGTAGKLTVIQHPGGLVTKYMHQSNIKVSNGEMVQVGKNIGSVGSTGASTGPHLHWETWLNGQPVNPAGINYSYKPNGGSVGNNMKTNKKGGIGGDNFTKEELSGMSNYTFTGNANSLSNSIVNAIPEQSVINSSISSGISGLTGIDNSVVNGLVNKLPDISSLIKTNINNLPNNINSLVDSTINQIPFVGNSVSAFLNEFPNLKKLGLDLINSTPIIKSLNNMIPKDVNSLVSNITSILPKDLQGLLNNPDKVVSQLQGLLPKDMQKLIPKDLINNTMSLIGKGYDLYNKVPDFIKNSLPTSIDQIPSFANNLTGKISQVINNPMSLVNMAKDFLPTVLNNPMVSDFIQQGKNNITGFINDFTKSNPMVNDIVNAFNTPNEQGIKPIDGLTNIAKDLINQNPYINNIIPQQQTKPQQTIMLNPSSNNIPKTIKSFSIDDFHLATVISGVLD